MCEDSARRPEVDPQMCLVDAPDDHWGQYQFDHWLASAVLGKFNDDLERIPDPIGVRPSPNGARGLNGGGD